MNNRSSSNPPTVTSPQAVIFDLDGTLLDTLEDLARAMNSALKECGLPTHPVTSYRYFVGDGATMLVKRAAPPDAGKSMLVRLRDTFLRHYSRNWKEVTRPYPGIEEMVDKLRHAGLRMAILSNKPHDFTMICVETFFNSRLFDLVLGERPGIPRKPDPTSAIEISRRFNIPCHQFIYLGDTSIDMKTATGAGMKAIGVTWGFRSREELLENGADLIIDSPGELMGAIGMPEAGR